MNQRETEWTELMRAANAGDAGAYHRFLHDLAGALRPIARRGLARSGGTADAEDVVQEILIAIHLKQWSYYSAFCCSAMCCNASSVDAPMP